jgi:sugar lactone lactonase YvrE
MNRRMSVLVVASYAFGLAACSDTSSPTSTLVAGSGAHRALTQADGTPVMINLANPRGLAWDPDSVLYVAEGGRGGKGPCMFVLGATVCYGPTGAVSRLSDGGQERLIDSLPSWVVTSNKSGQAQGPSSIGFNGFGNAYVTIALEGNPLQRNAPELAGFGQLVQISPTVFSDGEGRGRGHKKAPWEFVADIAQYEHDANPDCGDFDSNPFGVLVHGGKVIVADAGANALVQRDANGDLSTLAAFSNNSTVSGPGCPVNNGRDFVPTSVVVGPDEAYYIGHLNGLGILQGSSSIWRMEKGGTPVPFCTGFTWIIAMAFDNAGNIYVLQHSDGPLAANPGSLTRVAPDCSREKVITGLNRPSGLAVDGEGNVYISVLTGPNFASEGQVRRFKP